MITGNVLAHLDLIHHSTVLLKSRCNPEFYNGGGGGRLTLRLYII
jgi:hypothetical protein